MNAISPIAKPRKNIAEYKVAYNHPEAHRTSNMIDRLMQGMERHLLVEPGTAGSVVYRNPDVQ